MPSTPVPRAPELVPVVTPLAPSASSACGGEAVRRPWIFRLWALYFFGANLAALALYVLDRPLIATVVFFSPAPWFAYQVTRPSSRGFGSAINRFDTPRREVWLTIDDGPSPDTTPAILDLLDAQNAKATFFLIGQKVLKHPRLVAEILRRGHTIGNHTFTHPCWYFWILPAKPLSAEIDLCAAALQQACAPQTTLFRPPVGLKSVALHRQLARRGLDLVLWSTRGFDGVDCNFRAVLERICRQISPGAIILLHESGKNSSNVALIDSVLRHLDQENYRCVIPPAESLTRTS